MTSKMFGRRKLMGSLAAMASAIGVGSLMTGTALAKKSKDSDVRKLNRGDGKPADGKQMITPLIIHDGLIYIAGQGANSNGPVSKDDIETHTSKVMENVKELVQTGCCIFDSNLQITVDVSDLAYYDTCNHL